MDHFWEFLPMLSLFLSHFFLLIAQSAAAAAAAATTTAAKYQPSWASLDARPLPTWYDEAKLGIFMHWGVYSVPAFGNEWFWYWWKGKDRNISEQFDQFMRQHYPKGTTYADFANEFTAENFDADKFAEIVQASGARYFVLTSKHHEGFTLWPSATSWNWNSVDVGPHRNLVEELAVAIRRLGGIHFGLYFSLGEFFNPLYLNDVKNNQTDYVQTVMNPQLLELIHNYRPEVLWADGDWMMSDTYWRSQKFLAWLYNESPVKDMVVTNDRWGTNNHGKHGGFMNYDDKYNPGYLLSKKWENCMTLDRCSWGYRRYMNMSHVLSLTTLIHHLVSTISCGGNLLLNVGPDSTGRIAPIFEERLRQLGQWVKVNEEAIFASKPWVHQNDSEYIWYTSKLRDAAGLSPSRMYNPQVEKNTIVYAFILRIPKGQIHLSSVKITDRTLVRVLGGSEVPFQKNSDTLRVDLGTLPWQELPSTEAVVLKLEYVATSQHKPTFGVPIFTQQTEPNGEFHVPNPNSTVSKDQEGCDVE